MFLFTKLQHRLADNKIYILFNISISLINCSGIVIHLLIMLDNFITGLTKDINIILANQITDLHICSVHSTKSNSTIQHKLHVSSTACLLGSQGNLLGNIAGRDQFFSSTYIVVFHHNKLHIRCYVWVILNQGFQSQKQMNDILCNVISRSCFCTKDESNRSFWFLSVFDFQILINNIKSI